ncbi:MAG: dephospho-CoA kinase [Sedimentisphaerales bacterium]|nr:dephospho-CoA kinase [Sedimentisphaerales bacterium]
MNQSHKKPVIGLLGGVGSGKSTVAKELEKFGCAVINADQINHELLNKKEIKTQLIDWWGVTILTDGYVDREKLSELVFDDQQKLKQLTDLLHPLIIKRQDELLQELTNKTDIKAIILDVPLLLEKKLESICDCFIYVDTEEKIRHQRLKNIRGWDEKRIKIVENMQLALDIKKEISEYSISNNSGIPKIADQTEKILTSLLEKY